MKRENPALTRLLASVMNLHPKRIDLSLGRMEKLLAKLGAPQQKMPPTFHIAGTNGKGSVFANICSILKSSGATYHGYCSPHLVRFNERIILSGVEVSDEALMDTLQRVIKINNGDAITFFELTTAVAFLLFSETPADFLVCEVGLGGRLDSTNVITADKMAVFTPIDLDHQEFLGNNIEKIAFEKSGIITPATAPTMVTAPQSPSALQVLQTQAQKNNKTLQVVDYAVAGDELILSHNNQQINLGQPALAGAHQYMNGAVAAAAVLHFFALLQRDIKRDAIRHGLAATTWPARLQPLPPLSLGLPATTSVWLDGCHNPNGARAMAAWLKNLPSNGAPTARTALLFAMLHNRAPQDFLAEFLPLGKNAIHFFPVGLGDGGEHHAHDPNYLAQVAATLGLAATPARDWRSGLEQIKQAGQYNRVVICGSLYLAGELLAALAV
ncbi:MAG: folylpolyglutamate synthase/dihydrofolate synthase family protein [Hydrotalea sp.]|nr:folylpolyglutamate synthase/dihydrofolate synthase family protein [Hydrotalea sp.]